MPQIGSIGRRGRVVLAVLRGLFAPLAARARGRTGRAAAALVAALLVSLLVGAGGATATSPSVTAIDLGTLGGTNSYAIAMNDSGQVVGWSRTAGDAADHAFSWTQAGGLVDLGTLGGSYSYAYAVNDSGQVVGESQTAGGAAHAFSWTQKDGMVDLGTLGGGWSGAVAVNDSGQVVGWSWTAGSTNDHAFSWTQEGGMVDLGTLGWASGAAAVNDSGQVVGWSSTAIDEHPFSWTRQGGMVDLGTLGGTYAGSWASAVNSSGQVVGSSSTDIPVNCDYCGAREEVHAFSWTQDGGMVDLGTLGGTDSYANAVNDSGQAAGASRIAGNYPLGALHAFSWTQKGGMVDLGTLGGTDSYANAVNDSGQAVGASRIAGNYPFGALHAFSWTQKGGMVDLGTLGGTDSYANAVNDSGQAVGQSSTAGNAEIHAVLWQIVTVPGPPAALVLAPKTATNTVDAQHCVTATVEDRFGNVTPNITVRFVVTGAVTTSGSVTTNASGEARFCYTSALPGSDVISAYADTNTNGVQDPGEPGDRAAKTWVLPASTPGCKVSDGGRISAGNGDTATFGGNAIVPASGPKGSEEYQDHGPAANLNVHSIDVLAVTCSADGRSASIFGTATVNGSGSVDYRMDVTDNGEPGAGSDTYRIRLSTGCDSGTQTLSGGNVQLH
jgi:probable HAF family extracellular repeat protein